MSLLERIHDANRHDYSGFIPWFVAGQRVGSVQQSFAQTLTRWPAVFNVTAQALHLSEPLNHPQTNVEQRTQAVKDVCRELQQQGLIQGWRDEQYLVSSGWQSPPLLLIERAAVPWFGVTAYGVHLNGYVRDNNGAIRMWIARRSMNKPTSPGLLDQVVAGGQPHGISLYDNMLKECAEEASIGSDLARHLRPVGALGYVAQSAAGIRPDVLFNFDLELPANFKPVNSDGEVEEFYLWNLDTIHQLLQNGDEFKSNCALVIIDFFIRHGHIDADHRDYESLVRGLHPDIHRVPGHW